MSAQIDFRTMPSNVPVMCIPRVYANITESRIRKIFDDLDMGAIDHIDIVSAKPGDKGEKFNRIFVHLRWNNSENACTARERLLNGKEIKIIYEDPWFWKISAYREHDRSRPPASVRKEGGGYCKPTLQFDSDEERKPIERDDRTRPDHRRPDNRRPDHRRPDNRRPDNRSPDHRRPDNRRPDNRRPDNRRPDNRRPDNRRPDNRSPDHRRPDHRRPEKRYDSRERTSPDHRRPDNRRPDNRRPEISQESKEPAEIPAEIPLEKPEEPSVDEGLNIDYKLKEIPKRKGKIQKKLVEDEKKEAVEK